MDNNVNSFWKRPEGLTAKIIVGALVLVGGFAFVHFLPLLIALAENTLYLAFLIGVIGLLFLLVTADRPRTLLFYALQMISRTITGMFVEIDPVGILRAFSKHMQKRLVEVQGAIKQMRSVRSKLDAQYAQTEKELNDFLRLADVADQKGEAGVEKLAEYTERAGRRQQMLENFEQQRQMANDAIEAMELVERRVQYHITNADDERQMLETNNALALEMISASRAASEALGGSDKDDVRSIAVEVIRDRVAKATGEVESLMATTKSLGTDMEMNQAATQAVGKAKLQELRMKLNKADAAPRMLSAGAATPIPVLQTENPWAKRLRRPKS